MGTRASALARAQASDVALRLEALGHDVETVLITTAGDRSGDRPFAEVGAFGVFVRDIESALAAEEIDLAVHSYKDLPSRGPNELVVAAVPERLDAADVLLARPSAAAPELMPIPLRKGATVGTASTRREALIRALRPDLLVRFLRGNLTTRLRALVDGRFDAIIIAGAGLARLERSPGESAIPGNGLLRTRLDPEVFVPAPAQGAIAVQIRRADSAVLAAVSALHDSRSARLLHAERAILAKADAGCATAFGAWCRNSEGRALTLYSVLGVGAELRRACATADDPTTLADSVWSALSDGVPR